MAKKKTKLRVRLQREERIELIIKASIPMALDNGYRQLRRDAVAQAAGISSGLLNHFFGNIRTFQNAVLQYAIDNEIVAIVAQGISNADPTVKGVSEGLRSRAILSLTS